MINRLEFLIMFFGFQILTAINHDVSTLILSIVCGLVWCWCWFEDWNEQNDYEDF